MYTRSITNKWMNIKISLCASSVIWVDYENTFIITLRIFVIGMRTEGPGNPQNVVNRVHVQTDVAQIKCNLFSNNW
jgi:hypothetical protein